jgi:hypothetical protein
MHRVDKMLFGLTDSIRPTLIGSGPVQPRGSRRLARNPPIGD